MKTQEKSQRADKISSLNGQKKNTGAELEKTDQYLEDLKPACVDGDSSYDDRKAKLTYSNYVTSYGNLSCQQKNVSRMVKGRIQVF